MEFIKPGDEVLYVWHGHQVADLEKQVNDIKKIANVKVENAEVLPQGKFRQFSKVPSFDCYCCVYYCEIQFFVIFIQLLIPSHHSVLHSSMLHQTIS